MKKLSFCIVLLALTIPLLVGCKENTVIPSYSLEYNANNADSGNVPAAPTSYKQGSNITVQGNTGNLVKEGFFFTQWNTQSNGSGTSYQPGDSFIISSDTTLYAQWAESGQVDVYYKPDSDGNPLSFEMDFGTDTRQLFFIFTNPLLDTNLNAPVISGPDTVAGSRTGSAPTRQTRAGLPAPGDIGQRGTPEISEYNRRAGELLTRSPERSLSIISPQDPAASHAIGDSFTFDTDTSPIVPATLRKIRSKPNAFASKTKTLYIWVANDCWHQGGSKAANIDKNHVDLMADSFLHPDQDAIYEWVTGIFGEEYGTNLYTNLIPPDNQIHILLYDIGNDNSQSGGILGYYWAKDQFVNNELPSSNEKVMFYMDAVMFATTNDWQDELLSTLAHEFQHMIHWYQKSILRPSQNSTGSETWLNEMASLLAEDFVADKLGIPGPRGVPLAGSAFDYSPGSPGLRGGRLPLFNLFPETPVTAWYSDNEVLISYSTAYAFGAFLARHYGGPKLFRRIVQRPETDYTAVVESVNSLNGTSYSFADLLRTWGASVLLSDDPTSLADGSPRFGYNSGTAFSANGYSLGSINLHNYRVNLGSSFYEGPYLYQPNNLPAIFYRSASIYVDIGQVTGTRSWEISMPPGMLLTVVVKD